MKDTLTLKRAVKINTGNYENTDVSVEVSRSLEGIYDIKTAAEQLFGEIEGILREKIDQIELGQRKEKSKAGRFGV